MGVDLFLDSWNDGLCEEVEIDHKLWCPGVVVLRRRI